MWQKSSGVRLKLEHSYTVFSQSAIYNECADFTFTIFSAKVGKVRSNLIKPHPGSPEEADKLNVKCIINKTWQCFWRCIALCSVINIKHYKEMFSGALRVDPPVFPKCDISKVVHSNKYKQKWLLHSMLVDSMKGKVTVL